MLRVERLNPRRHDRAGFSCGEASLDDYLQRLSHQHHRDGISTTHVLTHAQAPSRILGYYSLAAAQLLLEDLRDADRKRLPRHPVPAIRMARLAVARDAQGQGHGDWLLGNAVQRSLELRAELGVRVLLVDALNANAAAFYTAYGFRPAASTSLTLYLPFGHP